MISSVSRSSCRRWILPTVPPVSSKHLHNFILHTAVPKNNAAPQKMSRIFAAAEKLNWAFKLYDIDNDGLVDLHEMAVIMEALDDIEGVKPGVPRDLADEEGVRGELRTTRQHFKKAGRGRTEAEVKLLAIVRTSCEPGGWQHWRRRLCLQPDQHEDQC